ncbi:MAG: DNA polymerase III subunit chi [Pseudomonadota bacterium]
MLPVMLQRSLARGWRAEVRGGDPARLAALDQRLWTGRDDGFLPHGLADAPHPERQPILLTLAPGAAGGDNRAVLFLVDGAPFDAAEAAGRARTALVFDGHDPAAVDAARTAWRAATAAGHTAVYWAQDAGRWVKKRESGG